MGFDDKAFSRRDHLVLVACSTHSSPVAHRAADQVDLCRTSVVHSNENGIWKAPVQDLQVPYHGSGRREAHGAGSTSQRNSRADVQGEKRSAYYPGGQISTENKSR